MKKDLTLEEILRLINDPEIKIKLTPPEIEFLRFYAAKRDIFNIRSFSDKEYNLVKEILDRLFGRYVSSQETVRWKLVEYGGKVYRAQKDQTKLVDYLEKLEDELDKGKYTEEKEDEEKTDTD